MQPLQLTQEQRDDILTLNKYRHRLEHVKPETLLFNPTELPRIAKNAAGVTIEWLSDNGSCYVAGDTRSFARDIGLEPRTTPLESPQSNGMAEAFVRTIKRDYVRVSPRSDAQTVMRQLPAWIAHYNEVHSKPCQRRHDAANTQRAP